MSSAMSKDEVERELARSIALFLPADAPIEFRAPKVKYKGTCAGYFTDIAAAVKCAKQLDSYTSPGVYVTLNPLKRDLLALGNNRITEKAETTATDDDVIRRQWVLIDCDPVRKKGISSTDAQHDLAIATARTIAADLSARGWPAPVLADSGNGAHLLYRVDMANTATETALLQAFLLALAEKYTTPEIDMDRKVFNASRITKLYGTMARKGEDMPDRPHRRSRLIEVPDPLEVADDSLFQAYVADHPAAVKAARPATRSTTPAARPLEPYDVEAFIARAGLDVKREGNCGDGVKWVLAVCPWNPEHDDNAAWIAQFASGAVAAGCQHNGCTGNDWNSLRAMFDPKPEYTPRESKPTTPPPALPPRPPIEGSAVPVEPPAAAPVSMEEFKAAKGTPVPEILAKLGAVVTHEEPWKAGGRRWYVEVCPWAENPEGHVAHVAQFPKGSIVAGCSHPDCAGKKWSDFKAAYAPKKAPPKVREARGTAWPDVPTEVPANEHEMLANYVVLVGTEKVWDRRKSAIVTPAAMKLAHGDDYKGWAKNPDRLMVDADKLVFKPEGSEPGELNLFSGLPVLTVGDRDGVTAWMDHAMKMAGYDAHLAQWIITRLAYKVQNPGVKIASSIVIHGEQGTGKNLFFRPLIEIFGRYGAVVGQQQIESPYTDWLSGKLMLIADEVASRGERYHVKNKLKALITSDMLAINEKFVSTRWERNCADIHFLSNDHIPLVIERGDRRYCVTRDDEVMDEAYNARLAAVDAGALKEALLAWDCGGFHAHTKPPETKAKRSLLDLTQEPADRFVDAWLAGDLPLPVGGAIVGDLYKAYEVWTKSHGERKVVQSNIEFGRHVGKRLTGHNFWVGYLSRTANTWSTNGERPDPDDLKHFSDALAAWLKREQEARL